MFTCELDLIQPNAGSHHARVAVVRAGELSACQHSAGLGKAAKNPFQAGSKAFESWHELEKLERLIGMSDATRDALPSFPWFIWARAIAPMTANLVIEPVQDLFEIEAVRAYLDEQPDALEDPGGRGIYLFRGHPSAVPDARLQWTSEPSRIPLGCPIFLSPERILVHHEYSIAEAERSALNFLRWLTRQYDCRLREDGYADLTEVVRAAGIESIYDKTVRSPSPAWAGELLQIGFFEDHLDGRGGVAGYRLKDCISETPQEHEAEILAYLRAGHLYRRFEGELFDVLDTSQDMAIEPALFTDGLYVWPSDLPYYVERYHARLPRAFVIHARKRGWKMPEQVDVSGLTMVEP